MKISTYITTYNSLFYQSTLEQTVRQSLLFSDEIIIVNSESSTDGTSELIDSLKSEYPNNIKIYMFKEQSNELCNPDIEKTSFALRKSFALSKCTGDWCVLQDDDEMIHEKYAEYIKRLPKVNPNNIAFRFNTIHFYRSYHRYQSGIGWYPRKIYMIKNGKEIKHGWVGDDPDNYVISLSSYSSLGNMIQDIPLDHLPDVINTPVTSYHYGWANRNDSILLMKKYKREIQWWGENYWNTHKFPFKFDNPEKLSIFSETHPKYMIPIIEQEKKFNSKHIKDFESDY